jgi:hypothetical protein
MIRRATLFTLLLAMAAGACGDAGGDTTTTTSGPDAQPATTTSVAPATTTSIPMAPDEPVDPGTAASLADGTPAVVTGFLVDDDGILRLCSVLAESYPPQCGGPWIDVEGIDRSDVVGVSTVREPGFANVAWTDFPITISGTVDSGALQADEVRQPFFSAQDGDFRVRLSIEPAQPRSGASIGFAIDVTQLGTDPVDVLFSSGQDADVRIFDESGTSVYTWSAAVSFIQMQRNVTLVPGTPYATLLTDRLTLPPGEYTVEAGFVAADLSDLVVTAEISIL